MKMKINVRIAKGHRISDVADEEHVNVNEAYVADSGTLFVRYCDTVPPYIYAPGVWERVSFEDFDE